MRWIGNEFDRDVRESMMNYLPKIYKNSKVVNEIIKTDSNEIEILYQKMREVLNQFFVETATWGLDLWEKEFDIRTDKSKTFEERRTVIKAKILNTDVFTLKQANILANSFTRNKTAKVIEIKNRSAFYVRYAVDDIISISDLTKSFEDVKPAHLRAIFEGMIYAEEIKISQRTYSFPVYNPICNVLHTDNKKGGKAKENLQIVQKHYGFDVVFPICNTFQTFAIENAQSAFNVMLTEDYRKTDKIYLRSGEVYTGEDEV